jgi:hypothetical protein
VVLAVGKPDKKGLAVTITCSLDCTYNMTLDSRTLTGKAIGSTPTRVLFRGALPPGRHIVAATATAQLNAGAAGSASKSFRSR